MPDGSGKYETQDIESFGGFIASKEHKSDFPDNATPYVKNFVMENGSLEIRKGFLRVNTTAYAGDVLFLIAYKDRDNTSRLFYGKV
jgi:hypothetical protein